MTLINDPSVEICSINLVLIYIVVLFDELAYI